MSQTRFRNDDARIIKELEMSSFEGRYALTTPGPGIDMMFREDPSIRMQKFGANLMTNTNQIENDLMGRNRRLTRDIQEYKKFLPKTSIIQYKSDTTTTSESRTELPAWTIRDTDNQLNRFESPWLNPQANIECEFSNNIQTRLLEKKRTNINETDWNLWLPSS